MMLVETILKSAFPYSRLPCYKLQLEMSSNVFVVPFQNVRPSVDNLPEDLACIVSSCWKEDPNDRPNFSQIIQMLLHYLSTISLPEPVIPQRIFTSKNSVLPPESPGTSALMANTRENSGGTPTSEMEPRWRSFFFCFNQCY